MRGLVNTRRCLVVLLVGAGACRGRSASDDTTAAAGAVDTTAPVAVAIDPTTGTVALQVAAKPGVGMVLTDASGRAVYILEAPGGGPATCTGDCATQYTPVKGKPTVASGDTAVQVALIAVTAMPDGTQQATYNGHPLYYYSGDQGANDTKGQGHKVGNTTSYLVTPQGTMAGSKKR
jgi:predicted lipoprotein with Yx(FWY)xxD motif